MVNGRGVNIGRRKRDIGFKLFKVGKEFFVLYRFGEPLEKLDIKNINLGLGRAEMFDRRDVIL